MPEATRDRSACAFTAGEIIYFHGDHLGSSVVVTNGIGALVDRVLYRPYGARVPAGGQSSAPEVGFTGQRFEASTGLYDYGARFYDPAMGRFLQPDPIVSDVFTPQTLNPYAYVTGSPLNFVDPTGMQVETPDPYGGLFDQLMPGEMLGHWERSVDEDAIHPYWVPDFPMLQTPSLGPSNLPGDSVGRMIVSQSGAASRDGSFNTVKFGVGAVNSVRGLVGLAAGTATLEISAGAKVVVGPLALPGTAVGIAQLASGAAKLKRGTRQLSESSEDRSGPSARNLLGLLPFGQEFDDPVEPLPQDFFAQRFQMFAEDPARTGARLLREFFAFGPDEHGDGQ